LNIVKGIDFSEKDVEALIKRVDANGSGEIDYNEFLLGAVSLDKILSEDRLEKAFKIFDLNHDNQISFAEIKTVLQDVRETDDATIEKTLKSIGKNEGRNSNLNFKEFKQFIKQLFK